MKFLANKVTPVVLELTYIMYVRPHLDYGDVIYHDQHSQSMELLEKIQYQAGLIVTNCWRGTSRVKLYKELGWESLSQRRAGRRLAHYYKILNNFAPPPLPYLKTTFRNLPPARIVFLTRFSLFALLNGLPSRIRLNWPLVLQLSNAFIKRNLFPQNQAILVFRINMVSVCLQKSESTVVISEITGATMVLQIVPPPFAAAIWGRNHLSISSRAALIIVFKGPPY